MTPSASSPRAPDVLIVGAGLIGLAIAWRAAGRGLRVTVLDPSPGAGASGVAAGMLAPVTEAAYNEDPLLRLNLASAAAYPDFVAELTAATGLDTAYAAHGTLLAAVDADDLTQAAELHAFQRTLGLDVEAVDARELRRREPMLAPGLRGGLWVAGDHQVDPRRLLDALLAACRAAGVAFVKAAATGVASHAGRVLGVDLADGTRLCAGRVVLAAGAHTAGLRGLPTGALDCLRPVKGQILRLRGPAVLGRTVRGLVRGTSIYLVPRADGEVVVGATVEEQGFDTTVTAGAGYELLRDALELVPALSELELTEIRAGLRPGTPDNGPLLGQAHLDGLVLATGHYRNGVLLTPITAEAIVAVLTDAAPPAVAAPFRADRFARRGAAGGGRIAVCP
jgi:glycine oxidase